MPDGLAHVVVPATDVDRTAEFYEEVVGLDRDGPGADDPDGTDLYWMEAGDGTRVGIAEDASAAPGGGRDLESILQRRVTRRRMPAAVMDAAHVALAVSAGELSAVVQRLHERDRRYVETGDDAYFLDPDGNVVAVTTRGQD